MHSKRKEIKETERDEKRKREEREIKDIIFFVCEQVRCRIASEYISTHSSFLLRISVFHFRSQYPPIIPSLSLSK